jgi:hypothetical protein
MSRQRKTPELLPVDEAAEQAKDARYFRLDPEQDAAEEQEVINLEPSAEPAQKLTVPVREEIEMRSNQPGIESLIDGDRITIEGLESAWGNASLERRPIPWGWFVLIAMALLGGAIWSLRHIVFAEEQLEVIRLETKSLLKNEETSLDSAREQIERIEQSLTAFCKAPNIDTMARFVRHPERVRPLMDDYYARHPFQPLGTTRIEALRPLTLGVYGDFWAATLRLQNGKKKNLIVQASECGETLVDWESAVNYQPMAWDDYVKKRPVGTPLDFRVYLEPDMLYSHEFRDSSKWNCYMLTALDSEEMLFGYVRSDSPTAQLLRTWFQRSPSERASMIMRLSIPEGLTSPRGVVIDHALSVRWIYIASPEGGSEAK